MSAILTRSGRFRIFSIADEPRFIPTEGMFRLEPEHLNGDWTFEPANRQPSAVDRLRAIQGLPHQPHIYAPTFADAEEALFQAEVWEAQCHDDESD